MNPLAKPTLQADAEHHQDRLQQAGDEETDVLHAGLEAHVVRGPWPAVLGRAAKIAHEQVKNCSAKQCKKTCAVFSQGKKTQNLQNKTCKKACKNWKKKYKKLQKCENYKKMQKEKVHGALSSFPKRLG